MAWKGVPIRAVLFDKDGTLVDFDATWGPAGHAVMSRLSNGDAAAFARLVALSDYDLPLRRFRPSSPLVAGATGDYGPAWADALGRPADNAFLALLDSLFAEEGLRALAPVGDPARLVGALAAKGLPLGIATNDAEENARQQMDALGLARHLAFVAGWDSGHGRKPGPGQVLAFARAVRVAPAEIALVGDTLHDLHAARAAGAMAVAVLTGPRGTAARDELAPHADHVIATLDELAGLLDQ